MKKFALFSFSFLALITFSCQESSSKTNNAKNSCKSVTLTELQQLLKTENKEDFLVERDFKKTETDTIAFRFAKCRTEYEDDRFWSEMVDLPKNKREGIAYTTIDNEQYIGIKNEIRKIGVDRGEKQGFSSFLVDDEIEYGFRVDASSSKKPNLYRILIRMKK